MNQENKFTNYLKKLEELEQLVNGDSDPDELIVEINKVVSKLSADINLDIAKESINPVLKYINLSNNPDPEFAKEGDSGFDIRANLPLPIGSVVVPVGGWKVIPTGLYFEPQKGLEIQIQSINKLIEDTGLFVLNSSCYDEIQIILMNTDDEYSKTIRHGDIIARAVVCPVYGEGILIMEKVDKSPETERNRGDL